MNTKSALLASFFAIAGISGANASDINNNEASNSSMDATVFAWEGGYIGAQIGKAWGKSNFTDANFSDDLKPDGFLGGIYAGYNFDVGSNVILGVEADLNLGNITDSEFEDFGGGFAAGAESELRWSGAVRARAGYAIDRFMPFIAGGVAFGNVKNLGYLNLPVHFSAADSQTLTGWTAGAGIDYAATDKIVLRLEYRHTDYGNADFSGSNSIFSFDTGNTFKTNDLRLGVSYKF